MALTPQIDNQLSTSTKTVTLPSKTYKLNIYTNKIAGFADGIEAVRQAVYHILMTERYAYLIYDNNYGIELEQYIGNDFDYLESTIQNTLKEALTIDLRIKDVIVTNITKTSKDSALIAFTVVSTYGDLQMEVELNV